MIWFHVVVVLAVNAFPLFGVFGWQWSPGLALILFWLENVANVVLVSARIWIHRKLTRKRGHWNVDIQVESTTNGRPTRRTRSHGTYLAQYLLMSVVFTVAHGVFVFLVAGDLLDEEPEGTILQLKGAAIAMVAVLVAGFFADLPGIRHRSFAWLERIVDNALGRVVAIHLVLIGGAFLFKLFDWPWGVWVPLLLFKVLIDLAGAMKPAPVGEEPPNWMKRLKLDRLNAKGGETFEDHWRKSHREEERKRIENEEVVTDDQIAELLRKHELPVETGRRR